MAYARMRRRTAFADHWPGFVDAMATLLLVVTFLLSVFMLTQYFVTRESSDKDNVLARLNRQLAQLTELLALERSSKQSFEDQVATLSATLSTTESENQRLRGAAGAQGDKAEAAQSRVTALTRDLDEQRQLTAEAASKIELLNQQLAALRRQIAALEEALGASEKQDRESQTRIADLGKRLNVALARKVQELERYRSDFFGRLRQLLGNRDDIRVVGDRFVFQAEVLFDSGSDDIKTDAQAQIDQLAGVIKQLASEIPPEVNWVIRVDGHTDTRPIANPQFPSNWELSSARAIAVVRRLIDQGVDPKNLVAAGFGEYQPLDPSKTDEGFRKNRRIELKLTEK